MKLIDGTEISNRVFEYLNNWNEENDFVASLKLFNESNILELSIVQFINFYDYATGLDKLNMHNEKIKNEKNKPIGYHKIDELFQEQYKNV